MTDPVISPDGQFMWTGSEWIPRPPQLATNIEDSVVMGDVNTKIEHSVHNTYTQDGEKLVRNHLKLASEKMGLGLFDQADEMYQKAKHIDYDLATQLYNGEFRDTFVSTLWEELCSHFMSSEIHNSGNSGIKARLFLLDRVRRILAFDNNHLPSLELYTQISLVKLGTDIFYAMDSFEQAERNCRRVLLLDPDNKVALDGIRKINFLNKFHKVKIISFCCVGLLLLGLILS